MDLAQGEDDDVFVGVDEEEARVAVGLAGVVDKARRIAVHGGVHHLELIDTEHITPNALHGKIIAHI